MTVAMPRQLHCNSESFSYEKTTKKKSFFKIKCFLTMASVLSVQRSDSVMLGLNSVPLKFDSTFSASVTSVNQTQCRSSRSPLFLFAHHHSCQVAQFRGVSVLHFDGTAMSRFGLKAIKKCGSNDQHCTWEKCSCRIEVI